MTQMEKKMPRPQEKTALRRPGDRYPAYLKPMESREVKKNLDPGPLRILVVDDDPAMREMLTRMLMRHHATVRQAVNGYDALQKICVDHYDLVISDIRMPEMDGMSLLQWIKRQSPHLEVIMMTGYHHADMVLQAMREGAADYLSKPFTSKELHATIQRCRRKNSTQPANTQNLVLIKQSMNDMRGGLVNIAGMTRLLQDESGALPCTHGSRYFEAIKDQVNELINLSQDYCSMATALAQGEKVGRGLFDLQSEVIDHVLQNLAFEIDAKNLTVAGRSFFDDHPPLLDSNKLFARIVFQNLFDRSIRFSAPDGKIAYSIKSNGVRYQIAIESSHPDIASPGRKESSRLRRQQAFQKNCGEDPDGIGLTLTRYFAGQCGGDVWCERNQNGIRFMLTFPAHT